MPRSNDTRAARTRTKPTADRVRWANTRDLDLDPIPPTSTPWYRTPIAGIGVAAVAIIGVGFAQPRWAHADPRLAPPGCETHTVERGDTMSSIARSSGIGLDALIGLNPHIDNPNRIWPGDQIATACIGEAAVLERHVDVEQWRNRWESDGVLSWESIIAELYLAGFRGDELVTMAAITPGESGRRPGAVGDVELQSATWGPSIGIAQIRSAHAQRGTGGARDEDALRASVEHQAWAAHEVFASQGFRAWTAHKLGWHRAHLDHARAVAEQMGVA